MLSTIFCWLEGYKDQIGLLIQAFLFVATTILIRVGWKQASAADAQARAAEAQVIAANEQAMTARTQLNMSLKEMFANLSAADAASRPILHLTPTALEGQYSAPDLGCEVQNSGLGPALEIQAFYGHNQSEAAGLYGETLGIGEKKLTAFNTHRAKDEGITLRYKSTHGSTYSTTLSYMDTADEFLELHSRVENVFESLVDLKF
jgi:hypothetical protein